MPSGTGPQIVYPQPPRNTESNASVSIPISADWFYVFLVLFLVLLGFSLANLQTVANLQSELKKLKRSEQIQHGQLDNLRRKIDDLHAMVYRLEKK